MKSRLPLLILVCFWQKPEGCSQFIQPSQDEIYTFFNKYCVNEYHQRLMQEPSRHFYDSVTAADKIIYTPGADSVFSGKLSHFVYHLSHIDTLKTLLDSLDYAYLIFQIQHPVFPKWDPAMIPAMKLRKKNRLFWPCIEISIPLFSLNHQIAVYTTSYWGVSHGVVYIRNKESGEWKCIGGWQDGT